MDRLTDVNSELLYRMQLHQSILTDYFFIVRVPGGWLYSFEVTWKLNNAEKEANIGTLTFVPYSDEFELPENKLSLTDVAFNNCKHVNRILTLVQTRYTYYICNDCKSDFRIATTNNSEQKIEKISSEVIDPEY